jgi:hypothetical protein
VTQLLLLLAIVTLWPLVAWLFYTLGRSHGFARGMDEGIWLGRIQKRVSVSTPPPRHLRGHDDLIAPPRRPRP